MTAITGSHAHGAIQQRALFCALCGEPPVVAGLCHRCYQRQRRSWRNFDGRREAVLERDCHTCRGCGAGNQWVVHHRRPGVHAPAWLVTICPACHAVIHKLQAHRRWLPPALLELWREHHASAALQLQLDIGAQ